MKKPTAPVRASHLNTGTAIPEEEIAWPETSGRVTRLPGLHLEVASRSTVTPYGGLALASAFLKRFRVAQEIDARVHVLKIHLPFHESDHVLAQALNLYAGGECLEDQAALQHDEGVLRMLGACRLPDPTTAGDFLRRFDERCNPGALSGLRAAIDAVQDAVWGKLAGKRKKKRDWAVLDLDGYTKALYGVQKEGRTSITRAAGRTTCCWPRWRAAGNAWRCAYGRGTCARARGRRICWRRPCRG